MMDSFENLAEKKISSQPKINPTTLLGSTDVTDMKNILKSRLKELRQNPDLALSQKEFLEELKIRGIE